jgi:signal transduction histidine kinase
MLAAAPEVSRHKCLIYDGDPSQQLPVVIPLLLDGLKDNWRCLFLGDPDTIRMIDSALSAKDVDTKREQARGALILSADRSHLDGGGFDPQTMIDGLCTMIDEAVEGGFKGLCATGDMKWELGDDSNFDRLLEYEALLERVFQSKPLRGICQYRRDVIPAPAVREALLTHRSTFIGHVLNRDNLFYIPPEILLERRQDAAQYGEWMCQQIIRVLNAEQKRDEALAALETANRELEQRVAERTAALEAFSYAVSHDLRAPLRAIGGFSDILAEEFGTILGDQGMAHLERVRTSVRRMGELIEGMLTLSKVMKANLKRDTVDLTALAEAVAQEARETAPGRLADFVIQRDLHAVGDRVLLRAVLDNLIGNAWKFTMHCQRARIEIGRQRDAEGQAIFYVRDNGAGFDMSHAHKLFAPFQRLHRQEDFPGTGVGLATVQRVIARHGGKIWAESQPGAGTTFFFTLPDAGETPPQS